MDEKIRVCSDKLVYLKNNFVNLINFFTKLKIDKGIYYRVTYKGWYFQNDQGLFILNFFRLSNHNLANADKYNWSKKEYFYK